MRQILADTNLPIAAVGWPHGVPAQALWRIVTEEHLVLTTYIIDEFLDVIERKFPAQKEAAQALLDGLDYELLPVATSGVAMRDEKDQPILDAAIAASVDVIVTGDKDFHALTIASPSVFTPRQYLDTGAPRT